MAIYAKNPIMPGFYPDPSICAVGEDYYLDMTLTEEEAYQRLLPMAKRYLQAEDSKKLDLMDKKCEEAAEAKAEAYKSVYPEAVGIKEMADSTELSDAVAKSADILSAEGFTEADVPNRYPVFATCSDGTFVPSKSANAS